MPTIANDIALRHNIKVPTWYGVGGCADVLATPKSVAEAGRALREFDGANVRVLGDGANLLVDDDGVDGVVLSTENLSAVRWPDSPSETIVFAEAGAKLQAVIAEAARRGLAGIEGLAGIPASIGGAVRMNAGGAYGQMSDIVDRVYAVDADGECIELERTQIGFGYRESGLESLLVTGVDMRLLVDEPGQVRQRWKEFMRAKKESQPLAANSAGCAFRNPIVEGVRISAGRLLDDAGCKGMRIGGAAVSDLHANFIVAGEDAAASDVINLMDAAAQRVLDHCGVALEREVVVWRRGNTR